MIKHLKDPHDTLVAYSGIGKEGGTLPAFIYFALSAEESLDLEPYNRPVTLLESQPLRVFSFDLPGHGPGFDKFKAMDYWAAHPERLEPFFEKVVFSIQWLIDEGLIDPDYLAAGGLSRGGFVATHIAAREKRIKTVLGFAPLTKLSRITEFSHHKYQSEQLDLEHLVERLTHIRHFRFYIGNRDTRVSTDACYHFIRQLVEKNHEKRIRDPQIELRITPSIGHRGHGTAPSIFEEGTNWVKERLGCATQS
ncbi:MAG: prolyl oligopeptidase family serine peptidase [Chlamydiales bacterium]